MDAHLDGFLSNDFAPRDFNEWREAPTTWRPFGTAEGADPRAPAETTGRLVLGKLVIPTCPHCGERHRHRFRGWGQHYDALCSGEGGYTVTEEAR